MLAMGLGAGFVRQLVFTGIRGGGVSTSTAPGEQFAAMARALTEEEFWGGRREFFELTVDKRELHPNDPGNPWTYRPPRKIIVNRIDGMAFPSVRGTGACDIQWSPDASQVTFDFHGVTVSASTTDL
jgi:hypothetical protein